MSYHSGLMPESRESIRHCFHLSEERSLILRIEELEDILRGLLLFGEPDRETFLLTDEDLCFALPEQLQTIDQAERAIELAYIEWRDNYWASQDHESERKEKHESMHSKEKLAA